MHVICSLSPANDSRDSRQTLQEKNVRDTLALELELYLELREFENVLCREKWQEAKHNNVSKEQPPKT